MKKSLLLLALMLLILLSGCSREIHLHCDCAEAVANIQSSASQTDTPETDTTVESELSVPISKLQFKMVEVLCDMFRGEWSYVDTVVGEVDTEKYFNGVELVSHINLGANEVLYSMIGEYHNTGIYVVVKLIHDTHMDSVSVVERYYANSGGKVLRDEYLQNFLIGYPMYENRIIPTDHYDLYEYFNG